MAEAAVVGKHHELKGQAIAAFVTLKEGKDADRRSSRTSSRITSPAKIGAIARPDDIIFAADLPKTRSGKIMRRLLKDIAEGRTLGDTTTLADPSVVTRLKDEYAFFDDVTQAWRTIKGLAAGRRRSSPVDSRGPPASELDLRPQLDDPVGRQAEVRRRRLGVPRHDDEEVLPPVREP